MTTSPRIAVVVPLYNAEDWIEQAIASVLDQSHPADPLIVVNDGSTDGSLEKARAFGDRVTVLDGPNRGACHARNRGMAAAKAAGAGYVLFLDSDDYFEGEVLSGVAETLAREGSDMVLSNILLEYYPGPRRVERPRYSGRVPPETFFAGYLRGDFVNPSGITWSIPFVEKIGGWDESLARAQDFEITLRGLLFAPQIDKNETGVAVYSHRNPLAITKTQSVPALDSRFRAAESLIGKIKGTSFAESRVLLLEEIYRIARAAFWAGHWTLGRRIMAYLRAEGFRHHPGTRGHRIVASLIGLEWKTRLWGR